jgi:dynein heavy chain
LILLVWKSSAYYNTAARLVILMREICNCVIHHATGYLNGDAIFDLIEAGETATAVKTLKTVLKVCGKLKTVYFEYKMRAGIECPNNPWSVQNNAVFVRLDTFLERCHDILDFTQTIVMFSKLAKIEIGGTKGKTLTTSIVQIYADFTHAIDAIKALGKGILDLENKKFEEAFYEFRNRIKELDRRLGSIIVQGFEDASTVSGRFRLLDSFDTLITRPMVGDALEKKNSVLIESIYIDLLEVQKIFDGNKEAPIIPHNLPPIAGSLTWSKSLRDRIELPIAKLKTLDKKIL